jgi:hypothetical protein
MIADYLPQRAQSSLGIFFLLCDLCALSGYFNR